MVVRFAQVKCGRKTYGTEISNAGKFVRGHSPPPNELYPVRKLEDRSSPVPSLESKLPRDLQPTPNCGPIQRKNATRREGENTGTGKAQDARRKKRREKKTRSSGGSVPERRGGRGEDKGKHPLIQTLSPRLGHLHEMHESGQI